MSYVDCLGSGSHLNKIEVLLGRKKEGKCCIFHLLFLCLEAVANGVAKTFLLSFLLFGLMSQDWFKILEVAEQTGHPYGYSPLD